MIRNAGLLPKPPRLPLWGTKRQDEGLDTAKRFLHVTANALVLEVEGEDEVSAEAANALRSEIFVIWCEDVALAYIKYYNYRCTHISTMPLCEPRHDERRPAGYPSLVVR